MRAPRAHRAGAKTHSQRLGRRSRPRRSLLIRIPRTSAFPSGGDVRRHGDGGRARARGVRASTPRRGGEKLNSHSASVRTRARVRARVERVEATVGMVDDARARSSWIWALGEGVGGGKARGRPLVGALNGRENGAVRANGEARGREDARARARVVSGVDASSSGAVRVRGGGGRGVEARAREAESSSDDAAPRARARVEPRARPNARPDASTVKLRAMTESAGVAREDAARERRRREAAEAQLREATEKYETLRRDSAALRYSHEKLKEESERNDEEQKRQIRSLKQKLKKTLERESRQRRRSVATLKVALDALRSFAPTAPNGRALGGSAVSAVITELSSLTESIALRDETSVLDEEDAPPPRLITSSWNLAEMERAKAQIEILERELEDAHEIIAISEKERVILERELASAKREIVAQRERHDEDLRAATEATTEALRIVQERNASQIQEQNVAPSPRTSSPPSPSRSRDLRTDVSALEHELANLRSAMRDALADVDEIAR